MYRENEMVQKRTKCQNILYKSKETTQNTLQKQRARQDPYKVLNEKQPFCNAFIKDFQKFCHI